MLWLNEYERAARIAPGLLALVPVSLLMVAIGIKSNAVISCVLSILSLGGGPILLAEMVRHEGYRVQSKLWINGAPTTVMLRLTEPSTNDTQRAVWRAAVEKVSGIQLASISAERRSLARADEKIITSVGVIREKTRDKNVFPVLWEENKSYGFQRNLYGIRWIARGIAFVAFGVIAGYIAWTSYHTVNAWNIINVLSLVMCGIWIAMWFLVTSRARVKEAGDKYAYQLLQAARTLAGEN